MVRPRRVGTKWQARAYAGEGKYLSLGTYATHDEALKAQLRHELGMESKRERKSRQAEVVRGNIRFQKYAEDLLSSRRSQLARDTFHLYTFVLQKHLIPTFGTKRLSDITPAQVRSWWTRMPEGSARRNAYSLLGSTMRQAVMDGEIALSPCRVKGGATDVSKRRPTFAPADAKMLMELAGDSQLRLQVHVLLASGMRIGELLGLNRGDVDLSNNKVTVRRHLTRHELAPGTKGHPDQVRPLSMPQTAMDALREHLASTPGDYDDALFRDTRGGRMSYHTFNKKFVALRASCGLDELHIHDLRHVHASEYAKYATLAEGMARTGHTDVRSFMRYQHVSTERDAEIIAAMEGVL